MFIVCFLIGEWFSTSRANLCEEEFRVDFGLLPRALQP
jgi:hypothetical protein